MNSMGVTYFLASELQATAAESAIMNVAQEKIASLSLNNRRTSSGEPIISYSACVGRGDALVTSHGLLLYESGLISLKCKTLERKNSCHGLLQLLSLKGGVRFAAHKSRRSQRPRKQLGGAFFGRASH